MKKYKWLLTGSVVLCLAIVLLAGCGVSQADYDALQAENADLTTELAAAQSDLTSLQGDYNALNADYAATQNELAEIEAVYPPRYFNNDDELEDWAAEAVPEVGKYIDIWRQHLELQKMALADGYIWSVSFDRDTLAFISVVIADDSIYWVWNDGYMEWVGWK